MSSSQSDCILTNARIVLADRVVDRGWLAAADGLIVEIGEDHPPERGEDLGGDLLMPGLIELHSGKNASLTDTQLDVLFAPRIEYQAAYASKTYRKLVELARAHAVFLASHDDTTLEHVAQAIEDRVAIAEFPTTVEAARALHEGGIRVLMGAPNLVRGGSHAGNVASAELAAIGALDVLSSDYMPASLLLAALRLPEIVPGVDLAAAIRAVTRTPAQAVGLEDRGEIAAGKRADLIRVRLVGELPVVRTVWHFGNRVA